MSACVASVQWATHGKTPEMKFLGGELGKGFPDFDDERQAALSIETRG